jgi:signal transduction histidine kinase/ActR/RegA family two-component response regulator
LTAPNPSQGFLDYVHHLLAVPADGPRNLPALLAELTQAFAARGAGLASLPDGSPLLSYPSMDGTMPSRRPWQEETSLLARVRESVSAVSYTAPGQGEYLLLAVCPPGLSGWLLWLEDHGRGGWTSAETSALALAGYGLLQCSHAAGKRAGWAAQMERLARRQQLDAAARITRRLAHDFGNVLTGILGFSDLSLSEVDEDASLLHKFLTELQQSAQNGVRFVERLRHFAHHSANPRAAAALGPSLAREEARVRKVSEGAVTLQLDLPRDLPLLAIDAENLNRVLEIIIENAREACHPGGGLIRVTAQAVTLDDRDCLDFYGDPRPGSHVEITVADDGVGLSAEAESCLFSQLFYTSKSRRRGLGLTAAYGLLRCHRGGLSLTNRVEGGALARIIVPVSAQAAHTGIATAVTAISRGESILVVDDDPMVLQFVCSTLGQAGYRVRATSSSREAFNLYTSSPESYRLVVSDVLMPEVNGLDLARQLYDWDAGVRMLFMSGHVSPEFQALDAGGCAFDLLAKPFRPEALLRAVRTAIDRAPSRSLSARKGMAGPDSVFTSSQ